MTGSLLVSLSHYVSNKYGQEAWRAILQAAELPPNMKFIALDSIDDATYFRLVAKTQEKLGLSEQAIWEELANYWILEHTDKHMPFYYRGINSAPEFLLQMNEVHTVVGRATGRTATPPEFIIEPITKQELVMTYQSKRKMLPYFIALIKAVAIRYKERVTINTLSENQVHISFA